MSRENPEREWGLPSFPEQPPRKGDVRDNKSGFCDRTGVIATALSIAAFLCGGRRGA